MEIPPLAAYVNYCTAIIPGTRRQRAAITQNLCRPYREQRKMEHIRRQAELTTPRNQRAGKQTESSSLEQHN